MSLKIISQGFKRSVKYFNPKGIRKAVRGMPPSENDRMLFYIYAYRERDGIFF